MRIGQLGLLGLFVLLLLNVAIPQGGYAARLDTGDGAVPSLVKSQPKNTGNGTIHLNFRDADILKIIDLISELTGKNFLVDDKVRGKITIIAPQPVSIEEAYQVFLSILEVQGYTVVPQGPIIKIIPSRDVKDSPIPTTTGSESLFAPTSDAFVTQLIPLHYADANDIRGLLSPLVSKESSLLAYVPTNTLILTEALSNIARLRKIISALDVEAPAAIFRVIPLKYAPADQLASSLQSALEALAAAGESTGETPQPASARRRRRVVPTTSQSAAKGPKILPDVRTNSLVLVATPEDMKIAEDIIIKLDIPTPEGRGQIHVYYLSHANAEELAQVLTAQASEIARTLTPQAATPTAGTPTSTSTRTRTATRVAATSGTTPTGIVITADKPTNSLVITADPEAYAIIKEIIQKLDIRRSQVLVESLIAEVTLDKARNLGVEWRILDEKQGTQVFASSTGTGGTGILNDITSNPAAILGSAGTGFIIGAVRNLAFGSTDPINIPVILRAFQGDTDVNVLATPNLLTTDNEEAEIIIGEERPFLRSAQDTPSGGIVSTTRTFEFRDTGITLRITPQISQGRTVRLQLFQEITRFVSEAEVGAVTTTKRTARTTVIVDDGQTIVIGGLIQETSNDAQNQVPCLGNVPVLGWAFKQTSTQKNKTNLLIFITPHILQTPQDIDRVTTHKRLQSEKSEEIEDKLYQGQPQDNLELLLN